MKKLFITVLSLASLTANAELPASVADALAKAGISEQDVAIYVQSVDPVNNHMPPLLAHHADKNLNPASVMKLVTTYAALDLLTPAYRWKTEIYRDGDVVNGALQGNLIIKSYGDPSFKAQEFWRLLMRLQQAGVQHVDGDLIIDKSYFAKMTPPSRSFDGEIWRAYNAEPSAFLVNGRNTSFRFTTNGTDVNIHQEFELPEVEIINQMKQKQGPCNAWRNELVYGVKSLPNKVIVTFSGKFPAECGEKYLELTLWDDEKYAFFTFKKLWRELGGIFNGQLKLQDSMPITAIKVTEQFSESLAEIVRDMNKWSNNLTARQLLLTIAAEKSLVAATQSEGAQVIKNWLNSKGMQFDDLVIENGSGLSRIERISAKHLGQMLVNAYYSPVMPELMASLPILSKDGTVMNRLKDSPSSGRAHLKTGSLDGVSTIAGYVLDANNRRYVMVMMVSHARSADSKSAQDALIEWLH